GWQLEAMDPTDETKLVRLLRLSLGYRDENGKAELTTRYDEIYAKMHAEEATADSNVGHVTPDVFRVVLPVSRVESANYFDLDVYRRFNPETDLFLSPGAVNP